MSAKLADCPCLIAKDTDARRGAGTPRPWSIGSSDMNRTMCTLVWGIALGLAVAFTPTHSRADWVQWRVADGGNGHYYQAVSTPGGITWEAAQAAAVGMGGYLATITSAAENAFAFNLAKDPSLWF